MKTTKPKAPRKPKDVSTTKQELRRLREFAQVFAEASDVAIDSLQIPMSTLRERAKYALTGNKTEHRAAGDTLAAEVKRLNALGRDGLMKLLNDTPAARKHREAAIRAQYDQEHRGK